MNGDRKAGRYWPLLIALASLSVIVVALSVWTLGGRDQPAPAFDYAGVGGDFTLESVDGPVSLRSLRGRVVIVFFGYTHCPDVCPAALANIAAALDILNDGERERVQALFVSVDPQRDTPQHLATYVRYFHRGIVGLSGSAQAVAAVARKYLVAYHKEETDAHGDYLMGHSSRIYLLDKEGRVVDLMSHETKPEDIAAGVRRCLEQ